MTIEGAPASLDHPLPFGTYAGESRWHLAIGRRDRIQREKKWQWFGASTDEVFVGGAIVRTGYAATTFVWVFDRATGEMLRDVSATLPRPLASVADAPLTGLVAKTRMPGKRWAISRTASGWQIAGDMEDIHLDIFLADGPGPMTAICPTGEKRYNVTRKQVSLEASGHVAIGKRIWRLSGGQGMLDHSHGLMDRDTSWLWAIGSGGRDGILGFNLIQGFNEGLESVVWTADEGLVKVEDIRFELPADPNAIGGWRVHSRDGRVDLTLDVEGVRSEDTDLGLVISQYAQPLGKWSGEVLGMPVSGMDGVAENHIARW